MVNIKKQAKLLGISRQAMYGRIARGWKYEDWANKYNSQTKYKYLGKPLREVFDYNEYQFIVRRIVRGFSVQEAVNALREYKKGNKNHTITKKIKKYQKK